MEKIVICDMIKELRQKAGYTQAQVSQMLNIQRQTYSNYENATRTPPLEIITALADLYHVSTDYLLMGSEPSKEEVKNDLLSIRRGGCRFPESR